MTGDFRSLAAVAGMLIALAAAPAAIAQKQGGILRIELNLHGFGRAGKVADHVLQLLHEFNVQRGLFRLDLAAKVFHSRWPV